MFSQVLTVGALHHADASMLRAAANSWQSELAPSSKPLLIVNLGGPTSKFCVFSKRVNIFIIIRDKIFLYTLVA